jgi:hypothetical protein
MEIYGKGNYKSRLKYPFEVPVILLVNLFDCRKRANLIDHISIFQYTDIGFRLFFQSIWHSIVRFLMKGYLHCKIWGMNMVSTNN